MAASTKTTPLPLSSDSDLTSKEVDVSTEYQAGQEQHSSKTEPIHTASGLPHDLEKDTAAPSTTSPEQVATVRTYSGFRWFLVCFSLYSCAFLFGLDGTIVADIQAPVIEAFGAVEKLSWLGVGFPLGSVASILCIGRAFGDFDVKWVFIVSMVMFEAGSALCGGAPSMNAMIIGRIWAGAGGAGTYLGVLNILSINTSLQERPLYMSLCGLINGVGFVLGPIIGGAFANSSATWRWAFYINILIFAVCSPVYVFILEPFNPQPGKTWSTKAKNIDWIGVVLNAAIYACLVLPATFGGTQWAWSDGRTIAMFVVLGVLLVAFAIQQTFSIFTTPERRIFPIDFLRSRTMVLLFIVTSAASTSLFIPMYYIPLFFGFVHGDSNIESAVRLLPLIAITIFATMLNGALMPRFGYYMPWYFVSGILLILGGSLLYSMEHTTTSNSTIYGLSVLVGFGAGFAQQGAYTVAQSKTGVNRIADAVGFISIAQLGGMLIALTITGAVFQNVGFQLVSDALHGLDFSAKDIHAALAGAKSTILTSVTLEVRERVVEGIVKAISDAYILVVVAGAWMLISACFMKREKYMEIGINAQ